MPRDLPTLRDPDRLTYYKEEVGGLVMGGYEPNPIPWATDGIPAGFNFKLLDADFDHFAPTMELAMGRVPALQTAGINELINGPESFTPDGNFILGESPELKNFFVGAGFNAFGIAAGGGAGMALAEWVHGGVAPYDLWVVDIRRFGRPHQDTDWVRTRTLEAYGKHYTMAWPSEEHDSGRPCRTSPLYPRLLAAGACFGEKLGWERPNWFASVEHGESPHDVYSYGRQNWFAAVGREHHAARTAAVLIDQTSFAKFALKGPDALAALNWICSNNVDKAVGSLTYTQMLDDSGGIQCDLTVCTSRHRRVLHRHRHRVRHARLRLDRAIDSSRGERAVVRHHVGELRAVVDGPAVTRHPAEGHHGRRVERGVPIRHAADRRHRRLPGSGACGSPTSASSAGSCTFPSSTRRRCTTH